jgi:beta-glucanase (GH16 family)
MRTMHGPKGARMVRVLRGDPAVQACGGHRPAVLVAALMFATFSPGAHAGKPAPKPPPAASGFTDHFDGYDATRWSKADGWKNGSPFDNAWSADHVTVAGGRLDLRLDDMAQLAEPYTSGELRTSGYYGYGCYEASFKPIPVPGVVTSLFTFAGPYDNGGNGKHNEIDIEFLGNQLVGLSPRVQLNFWANDDAYASRNEALVDLWFDPTQDYHRYGFKWTAGGIEWFIDGQLVHAAFDKATNPTPKATESLQKIMVNAWPVDETAVLWAGRFQYPGTPLHASYEWARHIAGADCSLLDPPQDPSPPSGDPTTMSVRDVALTLDSRATQVIARVSVVDGVGGPVSGATVNGRWKGVISTGDTVRTTDAAGVATFYSSRSREPGAVEFCVTSMTHASLGYVAGGNVETCDAITK